MISTWCSSPALRDAGLNTALSTMKEKEPDIGLKNLLDKFSNAGGVLQFVLLQIEDQLPAKELHKLAAITAIGIIDTRYYERSKKIALQAKLPLDNFFRLTWDSNKLVL